MLNSLHIKNFRCFDDLQIKSLGRVNLIVGKNNVGKSSLLEAMATFSMCQSISDRSSATNYLGQSLDFMISRRGGSVDVDEAQLATGAKLTYFQYQALEGPTVIGDEDSKIQLEFIDNKANNLNDFLFWGYKITVNSREYSFGFNQSLELIPEVSASGDIKSTLSNALNRYRKNYSFCDSNLSTPNQLSKQLDLIKIEGEKNQLIDCLKLIDERIEDIDFVSSESNSSHKAGILTLRGKRPEPLKKFGDGVSRLLKIMLHAYQAKKGYLLIDEFENGLHYSIQEDAWKKLLELAEELDIQVFATTHSQDTIKSFCKVAVENEQIDGKLISLGHSAKTSNKDQIVAVEFDEDQLKSFIDSGMEVRG